MKITVQRPCAVLRLFAGLFFLFITFAATAGNPDDWDGKPAGSIVNAGGGDGESFENPILIANAEELAYFARQVNAGGRELKLDNGGSIDNSSTYDKSGFLGYYFALSADIDLKGNDWTPIGNGTTPFRAHFDGKGHKVKGVKVKIESDSQGESVFAGLFGYVINGTLQNLGVELAADGIKAASTGNYVYAGGIVGSNVDATLRNCYVEGKGAIKITGIGAGKGAYAGGIAGFASAAGTGSLTLTNCYATVEVEVEVEATASGLCEVGGIAGDVSGTLSYTYATGNVRAKGGTEQYAGGICGVYSGGGELSHNLALNKNVRGDGTGDNFHRIVGYLFNPGSSTLYSNYANPGVMVNSNAVFASTPDSQDGGNTSLEDFKSVLRNAPSNDNAWSTAWVFPEGNLPQLRMATDEGKGAPSFADWPAGSQTDYLASKYLNAFIWSDYAATSIANAGGGDGKSFENPILIASAEELAYFARQVNDGGRELKLDNGGSIDNSSTYDKSGFLGYYFALSDDIDLKGKNWMPIGNGTTPFCAHFDGKGYKVKGVKVKIESDGTTTDVFAGLFGYVINGTLQNLGVELADDGIEAASTGDHIYAGGIAGRIQGRDGAATLRNCYVEGNGTIKITGTGNGYTAFAGGIAGSADAVRNSSSSLTLINCYATVDVEAMASADCCVGGIAGIALGTLSYTYATGYVWAKGGTRQYAGGICGYYSGGGELSHNLALNKNVYGDGSGDNIHRIASSYSNTSTGLNYLSNYANPGVKVNSNAVFASTPDSQDGADTYRETVREDLAGVPLAAAGWEEAWDWTDGTRSPRLKLVEEATDGSLSYPGTLLAGQLPNDAFGTLAALPLLHLTQATGGTLLVTAGQPATPLNDGDAVRPGTPLTLSYSTGTDYFFEGFFSGTGQGSVDTPLGGSTVEMLRTDLWLRASFRYEAPTPPEPVYYTVTLPSVEGVTTDPAAGSHQVESWDNFRFYLTLDAAYDQSVPVVTTDDGKTITPRTSDGAYVLKNVRSDLSVTISGIVKNPPVANEPVASTATRIFTRDGRLFITADRPMQAQVVALTGRIVRSLALTAGTTRIDALSPGIYLVRLDNGTVEKVIVRR